MIRFFLLALLAPAIFAADDPSCGAKESQAALGTGGGTIKICLVTDRLVPRRRVIFAVLNHGDASPNLGNQVLVLDGPAAARGSREVLYEDHRGIDILPFLFNGQETLSAISDFDRSGRMGWALVRRLETGISLDLHVCDPVNGAFSTLNPWAHNQGGWYEIQGFAVAGDPPGKVEIKDDEVHLPAAPPVIYKLLGGRYVKP